MARVNEGSHGFTCDPTRLSISGTRMWADAKRDGGPAEIDGAPCESSVIPLLVPHRKVWLMPAAGVPRSNAANIGERKTWT